MTEAENQWIRRIQGIEFAEDFEKLKKKKNWQKTLGSVRSDQFSERTKSYESLDEQKPYLRMKTALRRFCYLPTIS